MALESATARIFLAACIFILPVFFLSHHTAAATSASASSPPSFSFDFSKTSSYSLEDLRFEGDATLNGDLVDLTCNSRAALYCSGRMSYDHPVAFYDDNTGEVASFVTTFTFNIKMWPGTTLRGDGMTFFLSGYPSSLPAGSSGGGLGLTDSTKTTPPTGADRFVAIEFDTWPDAWDPPNYYSHIGIDLNSLTSVNTKKLSSFSLTGTMTATITFDNATRMLEATLTYGAADSIEAGRRLTTASIKTQLPDKLDALLPPVVAVGFSAATGNMSELHRIHSWSFKSTLAATETPTGATAETPTGAVAETPTGATKVLPGEDGALGTEETTTGSDRLHPKQGKTLGIKGRKGKAVVAGGSGTLALALLSAAWSTLSWLKLKHKRNSFGKESRLQRLEYNDLSIPKGKFSDGNKTGAGSSGRVYKGKVRGRDVAVKKIPQDSQGKFKDFLTELGTIGETGHENLVNIEGWSCKISNFLFWCLDRQNTQLFVIYELVPNGNLHEHLYDREEVLPWAMRFKIVKGLYSALNYLHHGRGKYILHRDVKPSNIFLDDEFNAKLGDFGLSKDAERNDATSVVPMQVATETKRYMDPQCRTDGLANQRRSSDVYSFGIVLLEIAHGKYDEALFKKLRTHRPTTFVEDFADEKLDGHFDKVEMERVILLGLRCSEHDANKRPSLDAGTLRFLEKGGELRAAIVHTDEPRPTIAPV